MSHDVLSTVLCVSLCTVMSTAAQPDPRLEEAHKRREDGHHAEAVALYTKIALNAETPAATRGVALSEAVNTLPRLNRVNEIDALLEAAIAVHDHDWHLLAAAAENYRDIEKQGYVIAGAFERGHHRGGGRLVNTGQRDRARALQLYARARRLALEAGETGTAVGALLLRFADTLAETEPWRLQLLSPLADPTELPDYDDGWRHGGDNRHAPTDPDGHPVFHKQPESFEAAISDGERWRALLAEAVRLHPPLEPEALLKRADFAYQQFGVHTLQEFNWFFHQRNPQDAATRDAAFALHTLEDSETLARLAGGIRRFNLPDDWNFIRMFQELAADGAPPGPTVKDGIGEQALHRLGEIYENRRQYLKAAESWKRNIAQHGDDRQASKQKRRDQILNPWGQFENTAAVPAGTAATVAFRYRNGRSVAFEARPVRIGALLTDIKNYLMENPRELEHEQVHIGNIGHRLIHRNEAKYLDAPVAEWTETLDPLPDSVDRLAMLKTPLKDAGAYLLAFKMEDGNAGSIVIWIESTVIVEKHLAGRTLYYVADAKTGRPVADATVEFFGYRMDYTNERGPLARRHNIITRRFAQKTDADGRVVPESTGEQQRFQWMVCATTRDPRAAPDEVTHARFAFLGYTAFQGPVGHDRVYPATKVFSITDRPVYRPGQNVSFKLWVRQAQYDNPPESSRFAGRDFKVVITNPRNEKILEKPFTTDAYGGLDGELALPGDATLGVYRLHIEGLGGQGSFRVEAYKKPEFEVKVDAPGKPLMLGDVITATVRADYLFGAPVTEATVKIKVTRTAHSTDFYPVGRWDWLYGNGYGWFGYDYDWYPGWQFWGCPRPRGGGWPVPPQPPELVAEIERPVGADGTVAFTIDTALAKAMHGDKDHRYTISADVTDASRRTITGGGAVIVARDPFRVFVQVHRGHYRTGETVQADFSVRGADGSPVSGTGTATLYRVTYTAGSPVETAIGAWPLTVDPAGHARFQFVAAQPGQYRLAAVVTSGDHTREGAYIFSVTGQKADDTNYRFNAIELVPGKSEYMAGETVHLRINTARADSTVLLFVRPAGGVYLPPQTLRLEGQSMEVEIPVTNTDMPNFFVEALTISDGQVHTEVREIVVPPVSRVLDVEVLPAETRCLPGAGMTVRLRVTDAGGAPFSGSAVLTVYDRAVEYISGGSNVPDIRTFFWKWRRQHTPSTRSSVDRWSGNIVPPNQTPMQPIGIFGHLVAEMEAAGLDMPRSIRGILRKDMRRSAGFAAGMAMPGVAGSGEHREGAGEFLALAAAPAAVMADGGTGESVPEAAEVTVRTEFADTAFWAANLETGADGIGEVTFMMPESLTSWRVKAWAMGHGTQVGEGATDVVTTKNLLLRLQAPRFFVEKDSVTLSANIHNYLETAQSIRAVLELEGDTLEAVGGTARTFEVPAGGQIRADWTVRAVREGEAVVRMKALGPEESDAVQLVYPVYVHGMLKTESFSGVVRPEAAEAEITFSVPLERRPDHSRLEVRYSPTLAGAMVDALPYLVNYPYGCTEQTLNRFLPTVITQRILKDSGISLAAIREKRINLNAQETGEDAERARQWQRWAEDPVFDESEVARMVSEGVNRLASMQNSDGGWGWFHGFGEPSFAHTTVVVLRGLLVARENGAAIIPGIIENGLGWLRRHQEGQIARLDRAEGERDSKRHADNLDANIHMTLVEGGLHDAKMTGYLYRDRDTLSVYGKCMLGMALHRIGRQDELTLVLRNIEQVLVMDDENQTAWLNLQNGGYWWTWYGSEFEAHAYYLKLLAATAPKSEKAAGLVKYLLNNRKQATYWNSTRDTALCIEALADYLHASGEDKPDMTVELLLNGEREKEIRITPETLFDFDNRLVLEGRGLTAGEHTLTVRRQGRGPVYFNAYLTHFTLEDPIPAAGLEIKVQRTVYRLVRDDRDEPVAGSRGQAVAQRTERYRREPVESGATLTRGELIEVELELESKNDYEYLIIEDMKAAGFEAVEQRSGYLPNDMGAYVELWDNRVVFFVRQLARGRHSVSYRLRAEIPGQYSALPANVTAMYAPELCANSDEIKLGIRE